MTELSQILQNCHITHELASHLPDNQLYLDVPIYIFLKPRYLKICAHYSTLHNYILAVKIQVI